MLFLDVYQILFMIFRSQEANVLFLGVKKTIARLR